MHLVISVLVVASLTFALAEPARAGETGLAVPGTVVVAGDLQVNAMRWSSSPGSGGTSISLYPSGDVFVAGGLSLGGAVGLTYQSYDLGFEIWGLGLSARVGYALRVADRLLLWPRAAAHYSMAFCDETCNDFDSWSIELSAPLVFDVAPHIFIGFGPSVLYIPAQDGTASSMTSYGLRSVLGGWF